MPKLKFVKDFMAKKEHSGNWYLLELAWEMGFTIAIPLAILVFAGVILDRTYHTTPFFIIFGIILSIFVSSYGVYKMMLPAITQTREEEKAKEKLSKENLPKTKSMKKKKGTK